MRNHILFSAVLALLLGTNHASAADGQQVIAAGEWSKPVADERSYALSGRLVLCEKVVSDERREVAVYIELQDASDFLGHGMNLWCDLGRHDFRPEYKGGLRCELFDKEKKPVANQPFPFGGAVPKSQWVVLPTDGTIRLRATPFGIHRPGALAICPDLSHLWTIADDDPNEYSLTGTFVIDPPAEPPPLEASSHTWRGKLELPPVKIFSRGAAARRG